jgi:putative Mn2+ efflux pump MntP
MNLVETVLIAVGLAMDCFAVSISCGIFIKDIGKRDALKVGAFFGGFQGMMVLIGWVIGSGFTAFIENVDHWIAFALLCIIGGKMIFESFEDEKDLASFNIRSLKVILLLSIATSIDALAIGVGFAFLEFETAAITVSIFVIALMSFAFGFAGCVLGKRAGEKLGGKVEALGGLILILIGVKILLEHLFF